MKRIIFGSMVVFMVTLIFITQTFCDSNKYNLYTNLTIVGEIIEITPEDLSVYQNIKFEKCTFVIDNLFQRGPKFRTSLFIDCNFNISMNYLNAISSSITVEGSTFNIQNANYISPVQKEVIDNDFYILMLDGEFTINFNNLLYDYDYVKIITEKGICRVYKSGKIELDR